MSCIIDASASSGLIGSGATGCVRYPIHSIASSSIDAANAMRGDGRIHALQLCFTGSAATRARTRTSNAGVGSTIGSSPSKSLTERNSFTRTRQIAHAAKCFSASARSLSFSRPSMYARIRLSIRSQLIAPILLTQYQRFATIANFSDQLLLDGRMLVRHFKWPFVALIRIRRQRSVDGHLQFLVPVVPQRIQREIRRNAKQPSSELRGRYIFFPRAVHSYKYFLRQVLRLFAALYHPEQEIHHRCPVALQQKFERLFVASLHVQHQLDVGPAHCHHTVSNTRFLIKLQPPFIPRLTFPATLTCPFP